jgi:hypothetical protein
MKTEFRNTISDWKKDKSSRQITHTKKQVAYVKLSFLLIKHADSDMDHSSPTFHITQKDSLMASLSLHVHLHIQGVIKQYRGLNSYQTNNNA